MSVFPFPTSDRIIPRVITRTITSIIRRILGQAIVIRSLSGESFSRALIAVTLVVAIDA